MVGGNSAKALIRSGESAVAVFRPLLAPAAEAFKTLVASDTENPTRRRKLARPPCDLDLNAVEGGGGCRLGESGIEGDAEGKVEDRAEVAPPKLSDGLGFSACDLVEEDGVRSLTVRIHRCARV